MLTKTVLAVSEVHQLVTQCKRHIQLLTYQRVKTFNSLNAIVT